MEWQAERAQVKDKRKSTRTEKKNSEKDSVRQELLDQKAKPRSKSVPTVAPSTPEMVRPDPNGLKSILKKEGFNEKKQKVSFSPSLVEVRAIPRVKSPARPSLSLRAQLELQSLQSLQAVPRKAHKNSKKKRLLGRR